MVVQQQKDSDGDGYAFSALEFQPEGEIMPQSDACARIDDNQLIRLAGKNQAAEITGDKGFEDIGQERDQAGLGAERLSDVGGAYIAGSKIADILRDFMPRDQISGLETAEEITDGNTNDAEHAPSPFCLRFCH